MKKRLVQALILSVMMVSLSASSVAPLGAKETIRKNTETVNKLILPNENIVKCNKNTREVVNECNEIISDNADLIQVEINKMQQDLKDIESISDRKEWFIAYKNIIANYPDLDAPETIYDYYTQDELNMLFRVVQAEIGDEYSFEQKCNVASVIFNRINHDEFENEMLQVLTSDQFETISNGRYKKVKVSEDTILACEYVFIFGDTTCGSLFFDSNNSLKYKRTFNDGAHSFYKK